MSTNLGPTAPAHPPTRASASSAAGFTVDFFLGTHQPEWLRKTDSPLFVSHRRLKRKRHLFAARARWAIDSGGFSELSMYGEWRTSPRLYAHCLTAYARMGRVAWASPQDRMCEPWILEKTRLTVQEHQRRTVESVLTLRDLLGETIHIIPVLQGWQQEDYLRHADLYEREGFDLSAKPVVGLGSVCRRQNTDEAVAIIHSLAPLRLHGFGFKTTALKKLAKTLHTLRSCDSMAWSFIARKRQIRLPGHTHT